MRKAWSNYYNDEVHIKQRSYGFSNGRMSLICPCKKYDDNIPLSFKEAVQKKSQCSRKEEEDIARLIEIKKTEGVVIVGTSFAANPTRGLTYTLYRDLCSYRFLVAQVRQFILWSFESNNPRRHWAPRVGQVGLRFAFQIEAEGVHLLVVAPPTNGSMHADTPLQIIRGRYAAFARDAKERRVP